MFLCFLFCFKLSISYHSHLEDVFIQSDLQMMTIGALKTHIYINIYTFTGHFIRVHLASTGLDAPLSSELLNPWGSSWNRFNKVLEIFLRDFGPY